MTLAAEIADIESSLAITRDMLAEVGVYRSEAARQHATDELLRHEALAVWMLDHLHRLAEEATARAR